MKNKSEAATLGIKAPKTTYEKNICLFLKRNNNESTVDGICEKFNENKPIIVGLLNNMQKSGLVSMDNNKVFFVDNNCRIKCYQKKYFLNQMDAQLIYKKKW